VSNGHAEQLAPENLRCSQSVSRHNIEHAGGIMDLNLVFFFFWVSVSFCQGGISCLGVIGCPLFAVCGYRHCEAASVLHLLEIGN
jgi:hypothetical protein